MTKVLSLNVQDILDAKKKVPIQILTGCIARLSINIKKLNCSLNKLLKVKFQIPNIFTL